MIDAINSDSVLGFHLFHFFLQESSKIRMEAACGLRFYGAFQFSSFFRPMSGWVIMESEGSVVKPARYHARFRYL